MILFLAPLNAGVPRTKYIYFIAEFTIFTFYFQKDQNFSLKDYQRNSKSLRGKILEIFHRW
jgi:hypothetical protein